MKSLLLPKQPILRLDLQPMYVAVCTVIDEL